MPFLTDLTNLGASEKSLAVVSNRSGKTQGLAKIVKRQKKMKDMSFEAFMEEFMQDKLNYQQQKFCWPEEYPD